MCMGTQLSKAELKKYIEARTKDGAILVWKVVQECNGHYVGPIENTVYGDYVRQPGRGGSSYTAVHAFRNRASAVRWVIGDEIVVQCRIKPEWIRAIGGELFGFRKGQLATITARFMVMPEYPKKTVSLERFRKICKESNI